MKKVFSMLLVLLMFTSVIGVYSCAAGNASISVSTAPDATLGDEVSLTVSLDSNPGIAGLRLYIIYDESRLSLTSCKETGLSGMWNINGNQVIWANSSNSTYSGPILNLTFKVLDSSPLGKADVTVSYNAGDITDADLNDVNPSVIAGGVNIICNHVWDNGKVTKEPTCTEKGVKTFTCSVCGGTRTEDIPMIAHKTELKNVKEATCTEKGYTGDTVCSVCGKVVTAGKEIPMADHKWDNGKVTKAPSCTEKGVKTFTCSVCGGTRTEDIPMVAHKTELKNVKEATCTEKGYTGDMVCSVCGKVVTAGKETPMADHKWDNGKVTKEPTCTEKGVKTFTCSVCGGTRTEDIPMIAHKTELKNVKEATCTEKGYTGDMVCSVCGKVVTAGKEIPMADHKWDNGKVTTDPTCVDEGVKTFTCKACGETKTENLPALGHDWDKGKVTKEPTNTATGEKTYTCKRCGETKVEILPVVSPDDKPATGDNALTWLWIALLFVSGSAAAVTMLKKREN